MWSKMLDRVEMFLLWKLGNNMKMTGDTWLSLLFLSKVPIKGEIVQKYFLLATAIWTFQSFICLSKSNNMDWCLKALNTFSLHQANILFRCGGLFGCHTYTTCSSPPISPVVCKYTPIFIYIMQLDEKMMRWNFWAPAGWLIHDCGVVGGVCREGCGGLISWSAWYQPKMALPPWIKGMWNRKVFAWIRDALKNTWLDPDRCGF